MSIFFIAILSYSNYYFLFIFFYKIVYKIDIIDIELKISKLAKNIST